MQPREQVEDLGHVLTQSATRNAVDGARSSGPSGQTMQQQQQHQQQQQQAQQRPATKTKEPRSRPPGDSNQPQRPPTPTMSISAATSTSDNNITPPSTKQWARPQAPAQRPNMSDSTPSTFPQWGALEAAMNTVRQVQQMERKTQALEEENQKLKAQLAEMKTNAINWCMLAKSYQQDRNYIGVQLSELEVKLAQAQRRPGSSSDTVAAKGTTTTATAARTAAEKGAPGANVSMDDIVSQSISELLDTVANSNNGVEPRLPPLSKGHYSMEKKRTKDGPDGASKSRQTEPLRSVLKTSSSVSSCACGCQEELRAWKLRSAFAENQIPILEMRCEKQNIILEGYKAKWSQWKESLLRAQYERRLKASMPHHIARLEATSDLQPASLPQGSLKRTRFAADGGIFDSSQQRSETTQQNTLFNQFSAGLPLRSVSPVGISSSSKPGVRFGSGSATEPHILLDDNDSDERDKAVQGQGSSIPNTYVLDSDDDGYSGPGYVSQPKSLTFPSDLALRRRRLLSEEEDEEEDGEAEGHIGSISPSKRSLQRRSLKRPVPRMSRDQLPEEEDHTSGRRRSSRGMQSLESDRSSPPMFEYSRPHIKIIERTADPAVTENEGDELSKAMEISVQGPSENNGRATESQSEPNGAIPSSTLAPNPPADGTRINESSGRGIVPKTTPEKAQPRVYVPETPLEFQGITPRKDDGPHNVVSGMVASKPQQDIIPLDDFDNAPTERPSARTVQGQEQGQGHEHDQDGVAHEQEDWPGLEDDEDPRFEGDDRDALMTEGQGTSRSAQKQPAGTDDERIYNFTERRKDKRKQMHAHDCACCQKFYKITGALPLPDGYNAFFTPAPRPGQKEVWEQTPEERLQDRIQQVSRHRVQHEVPLTPPGFWDTDFPLTPERLEWDRIAEERKARKKQRLAHEEAARDQARRYGQGRDRD